MLSGPMIYFYIRNSLQVGDSKMVYAWDWIHYIPALVTVLNYLPFFTLPYSEVLDILNKVQLDINNVIMVPYLFVPFPILFLIRPILGVAYLIVSLFKINQHSNAVNLNFKWLYLACIAPLLNFLMLIMLLVSFIVYHDHMNAAIFNKITITFPIICLVLLNVSVLFFPSVIYGDLEEEQSPSLVNYFQNSIDLDQNPKLLLPDLNKKKLGFQAMADKLDIYFYNKPYLQPGFNFSSITADTDIPYHKISSYFTEYLGENFNDWKNDKRIDYAIDLINHGRAKNCTLESIAFSCGFLSRSNFVNAFKKKLGITPSEYLRNLPGGDLVVKLDF